MTERPGDEWTDLDQAYVEIFGFHPDVELPGDLPVARPALEAEPPLCVWPERDTTDIVGKDKSVRVPANLRWRFPRD